MYYIGIDGGGTKTAFGLFQEDGTCIKEVQLSSCHILQVEKARAIEVLTQGVQELKQALDPQAQVKICVGLAGYGYNQAMRQQIEEICANSFPNDPYVIHNDGEIALAGALDGADGILVIAGTGSLAIARKHGEMLRCGGWGATMGDEGSAYWIAQKMLQEYSKQWDGRSEKTQLCDRLKAICECAHPYDMIPYVNQRLQGKRDLIAQLAMQLLPLAQANDPAALRIYEECAQELAEMILALAKQFEAPVLVSTAGGVWQAGAFLTTPLQARLQGIATLIPPVHPPLYGAFLLAKEA